MAGMAGGGIQGAAGEALAIMAEAGAGIVAGAGTAGGAGIMAGMAGGVMVVTAGKS
jgi:hypothetical protein